MVQPLLADFLNDRRQYGEAERLWRARWEELLRRVGQEAEWVSPWLKTTFADGTPFADGNPIFSAVAPQRRLGVRVIQLEPSEDPPELSFWIDTFAEGEPESIKELVIACVLTPQRLDECLGLMERWITGEEIDPPAQESDTHPEERGGSGRSKQ